MTILSSTHGPEATCVVVRVVIFVFEFRSNMVGKSCAYPSPRKRREEVHDSLSLTDRECSPYWRGGGTTVTKDIC